MATSSPAAARARHVLRKPITFTGAAGLGAIGTVAAVTTFGTVHILAMNIHCVTSLTSSGGTISLGISGETAALIPLTTASAIDAGFQWTDNVPGKIGSPLTDTVLSDSLIFTIATADITAGSVEIEIMFDSLSSDGNMT